MAEWTEERVKRLKELYAQGLSSAQIARNLGDISRNGVIGKVTRLGLNADRKLLPQAPRTRVARAPTAPRVYATRNIEAEAPVEIDGKHVTLVDLTSRHCKWPIGDPATEDFYFCGQPPILGRPYCEAHCRKAYQPMTLKSVDHRGREK